MLINIIIYSYFTPYHNSYCTFNKSSQKTVTNHQKSYIKLTAFHFTFFFVNLKLTKLAKRQNEFYLLFFQTRESQVLKAILLKAHNIQMRNNCFSTKFSTIDSMSRSVWFQGLNIDLGQRCKHDSSMIACVVLQSMYQQVNKVSKYVQICPKCAIYALGNFNLSSNLHKLDKYDRLLSVDIFQFMSWVILS